ncbi:hypothetical protein MYSTI_07419 [Myxococcus stipitatus DSM 14675]|uniref:Uncharacterized protein n=1 Tax=Myxococcus stipitatus (strain DSM 14675 / JCM 12634 / Mx s8) TaxID=1278073 RepID=L7UI98_MYXSD|nr:hypothetical protein MYSTI_07419 [Myxococcus stipitatus DSM 14675]
MPFAYFDSLPPDQQRAYRMSDGVSTLRVRAPAALGPLVAAVREALATGERPPLERATAKLSDALCERLDVATVRVEVLEVRPSTEEGELHGLYTWEPGRRPRLQVWMRTAKQARVVAFRTYLRTFLHELCHHLDFQLLELPHSFHTNGFFQRESNLFQQLVPRAMPRGGETQKARARNRKGVADDTPPR